MDFDFESTNVEGNAGIFKVSLTRKTSTLN